jgi:hypothetical protein
MKLDAPPLEGVDWALFSLAADGGKSLDEFKEKGNFIEDAASTDTIIQLLDKLKIVFNSDYIIKDGTLHFDRVDRIDAMRNELFSIAKMYNDGRLSTFPCFKYIEGQACSYLRPEYCQDGSESEGNDISRSYGHGDLIEWNEDNDHWKKGECKVDMPFSAARFMFDKKTFDDRGFYNWNFAIDKFRRDNSSNFGQAIFSGLLLGPLFGAICGEKTNNALIVSQMNRTSCMKLIALDPASDYETNAKVLKRPLGIREGIQHHEYNYPFYMLEANADGTKNTDGLYPNFHEINDPDKTGREVYEMTRLEWNFICEELDRVYAVPCGWYVSTELGRANIDKIKFKLNKGAASADGGKIRC